MADHTYRIETYKRGQNCTRATFFHFFGLGDTESPIKLDCGCEFTQRKVYCA